MLVANIKIWKSHLNIREGSDYTDSDCNQRFNSCSGPRAGLIFTILGQ